MANFSTWDRMNLEAVANDMLQRILRDTATDEAELLPLLELKAKLAAQRSGKVFGIDRLRFGIAVGLCIGCGLASFGWVAFFWLSSLSR